MAEITAAMVKALRDETGQGMMECKKALAESKGDFEVAKDHLRKKGLVSAAKKAERATAEGLIGIRTSEDGTAAAMVEIRCETDFCARNDVFREMVQKVADKAFEAPEGEVEATEEIAAMVQEAFNQIGENMSFGRGVKVTGTRVGTYLHHNQKVGVVVAVDKEIEDETLRDICMHVAFANPIAITPDEVPADLVEKERKFALEEAVASGKPQEIAEKIVAGKMRKFLSQNALMEQPFVKDEKKAVKEVLDGANIKTFARFSVGT